MSLPAGAPAARALGTLGVLICSLLSPFGPLTCLAQQIEQYAQAEQESANLQLADLADRAVSGEAVVDLADFLSSYLSDSGALPDFMQVQTADGALRTISTAEAFTLLARTAYLWETMGWLPATVPIAPDGLSPPLIDPTDAPASQFNPDVGREIPTGQFLSQLGPTVHWIDRLRTVPTAVWVDGQRLSAAEYLSALAICIQYAYWEETLLDTIYLPRYRPPQSWIALYADRTGIALADAAPESLQQWTEPFPTEPAAEQAAEGAAPPLAVPLTAAQQPPASPAPQLTVYPRPGSTIGGSVDLAASYVGPPARFVLFIIDGATRAIMNSPPYSYRWDTSTLQPGPHTVRVQVLGEQDQPMADQICGYTVEPSLVQEEAIDDL